MNIGTNDLLALSEMFGSVREGEKHVTEGVNGGMNPASLVNAGPGKVAEFDRPIGQIKDNDPKQIWKDSEIPNEEDVEDYDDTRPRPEFEILYKQNVMTEDVFLGMGDKDPSSAHCEAMTIKITFPGHTMKDLELDVTKTRLVAESSRLKLSTYLPHPVRHQDGTARWDTKSDTLIVTLPIIRDEW